MRRDIPTGVWRACRGLIEAEGDLPDPCRDAIKQAENAVRDDFPLCSEPLQNDIVSAVKLSLRNQKDFSFCRLQRRYGLPLTPKTFYREKEKFVVVLVAGMGWAKQDRAE